MAQHAPQASALSDEQEYLQAYEDVLEKYKGRGKSDWVFCCFLFGLEAGRGNVCDCWLTVQ